MDSYFFDRPLKAIVKGGFLLITYIGSICFKQFSIGVVLPTVLLYFLSNISDYAELAFMDTFKTVKIKGWSLVIFLFMLVSAVVTFCLMSTDNVEIKNFVNGYYGIIYVICSVVWLIPMVDGIRGRFDQILSSGKAMEQQAHSSRAFEVMKNETLMDTNRVGNTHP